MQLTNAKRWQLLAANSATTLIVLVCLGVLAFLSTRYTWQFDWTASGRNTLSQTSIKILGKLPNTLRVEVFARPGQLQGRVLAELLRRYTLHKTDIEVSYTNPDLNPERLRALEINQAGALILEYDGRRRTIQRPSERNVSNALIQLVKAESKLLAYLLDHGERKLDGKANHDYGRFGVLLKSKGFAPQGLSLTRAGSVPSNTDVLLVAGPRVDLQPAEVTLIQRYVDAGGNLAWFLDPGPLHGLDDLARSLGIRILPGTIIDPATQQLGQVGLSNPTYALITRYAKHPAVHDFNLLTVFPGAAALAERKPNADHQTGAQTSQAKPTTAPKQPFTTAKLLQTNDTVWSEGGPLHGSIRFDVDSDKIGPFAIGLALSRTITTASGNKSQRIAIIGDGDFLSNAALGNSGNADLGLRLFTWLAGDDELIDIPARTDPDSTLNLTALQTGVIGLTALLGLPLLLIASGIVIWWRRRHR